MSNALTRSIARLKQLEFWFVDESKFLFWIEKEGFGSGCSVIGLKLGRDKGETSFGNMFLQLMFYSFGYYLAIGQTTQQLKKIRTQLLIRKLSTS